MLHTATRHGHGGSEGVPWNAATRALAVQFFPASATLAALAVPAVRAAAHRARPQDLLVNCVVEPPGYLPVTAEVQIHLLDTIVLKEGSVHKFYEVTRASSAAVFLAEAKGKRRATGSAPGDVAYAWTR